jgi:cobalamin synthase
VVASLWALFVGVLCVGTHRVEAWRALTVLLVSAVVTGLTAWRYERRAGGITGDFLGATEQICELVGLAVMAWGRA